MRGNCFTRLYICVKSDTENIMKAAEQLVSGLSEEGIEVVCVSGSAQVEEQAAQSPKGSLWIADCGEMVSYLARLKQPVVAWLHEGNQSESFREAHYAVESPQELGVDFYDRVYRRYAGIPWDIAETDRCLIRETVPEDAETFARIYAEPGITRYTDAFCREADAEREYIREYIEKIYDFYGYGVWTVVWKETGEVIGRVGFEQEAPPCLGYMIAGGWQGRGIAFEVCSAVLALAREELGFEAVQVKIQKGNEPSLRLARKLGFREIPGEEGLYTGMICCS